jgi:hypothetical protein
MSVIRHIGDLFDRISSTVATMRRLNNFTCGDCERAGRCGQPPSETCIYRAEQMSRDDWKARRRANALIQDIRRI